MKQEEGSYANGTTSKSTNRKIPGDAADDVIQSGSAGYDTGANDVPSAPGATRGRPTMRSNHEWFGRTKYII
jgi:hypothetical protein